MKIKLFAIPLLLLCDAALSERAFVGERPLRPPQTWVRGGTGFHYAPSIVEHRPGEFRMYYCGNSMDPSSWDIIRTRTARATAGGYEWGEEAHVLGAASAPTGASVDRSACDPEVFHLNGYWYMLYTGNMHEAWCNDSDSQGLRAHCGQSAIFLARSSQPDRGFRKFNGVSENRIEQWEPWIPKGAVSFDAYRPTPAQQSPAVLVRRSRFGERPQDRHSYGAGQSSVVIKDGTLYHWYYDDSDTQVNRGLIYMQKVRNPTELGQAARYPTNVSGAVSASVKWDNATRKFVMVYFAPFRVSHWLHRRDTAIAGLSERAVSLLYRTSLDGINWSTELEMAPYHRRFFGASNVGVSASPQGWLSPNLALIGFGASTDTNGCHKYAPLMARESCEANWDIAGLEWRYGTKPHLITSPEALADPLVFDVAAYVGMNPDLRHLKTFESLERHWIDHGLHEGRLASFEFNVADYFRLNPDVANAVREDKKWGIYHFLNGGRYENRLSALRLNPLVFNPHTYSILNDDVPVDSYLAEFRTTDFAPAVSHWLTAGINTPYLCTTDIFCLDEYLELNPDVAAAYERLGRSRDWVLEHYLRNGIKERRKAMYVADPAVFDFGRPVGIRAALLRPVLAEGTRSHLEFSARLYLKYNPDIAALCGPQGYRCAIRHYVQFGQYEKARRPSMDCPDFSWGAGGWTCTESP